MAEQTAGTPAPGESVALSRDLLCAAVETAIKAITGHVTCSSMQRQTRVGFATAARLVAALERAGVLGDVDGYGRRPVLAVDVQAGHRLIAAAIAAGRIEVDQAAADAPPAPPSTRE